MAIPTKGGMAMGSRVLQVELTEEEWVVLDAESRRRKVSPPEAVRELLRGSKSDDRTFREGLQARLDLVEAAIAGAPDAFGGHRPGLADRIVRLEEEAGQVKVRHGNLTPKERFASLEAHVSSLQQRLSGMHGLAGEAHQRVDLLINRVAMLEQRRDKEAATLKELEGRVERMQRNLFDAGR